MEIEFDEAKNEKNIRERGLSFERAREFEFQTAQVRQVQRHGESRFTAVGHLDGVLHMLCFVVREQRLRVISFRIAGRRERRDYAAEQETGE